jgi:hypothetical protein
MHLCLPTSLKTQIIEYTVKLKKKKTVRLEVYFFNKILLKDYCWEVNGLGITYCFISLSYD